MSALPLDLHVRALLDGRKGDWQAVADGAGVSYSWLSKFFNGHIDNPGFATLTKLRDFLEKPRAPNPEAIPIADQSQATPADQQQGA